jgi:hypothetical protein
MGEKPLFFRSLIPNLNRNFLERIMLGTKQVLQASD